MLNLAHFWYRTVNYSWKKKKSKIANKWYWRKDDQEEVCQLDFKTKDLAVWKLKENDVFNTTKCVSLCRYPQQVCQVSCGYSQRFQRENEHAEMTSFMYNLVKRTNTSILSIPTSSFSKVSSPQILTVIGSCVGLGNVLVKKGKLLCKEQALEPQSWPSHSRFSVFQLKLVPRLRPDSQK